ncbi:tape measure protein [Lactococcus lactis]|uniref:tape measure protein n=1 Tax=Lactococcus lactis TaxID=1358 RepID=UPI0023EA4CA8|nr:tape measure protein [Lactococcus lactis]
MVIKKLNDSLVDNIKNLREESGYSIDTLSLLTKKTYGLTGSADGAKKLSDAFVNLGRATGKSDDAMQNIITKFTQMNASGEITSGSITKNGKKRYLGSLKHYPRQWVSLAINSTN